SGGRSPSSISSAPPRSPPSAGIWPHRRTTRRMRSRPRRRARGTRGPRGAAPCATADASRCTSMPNENDQIAIVGMAGRFPRAGDLDAFWRNLREGVESVSFWSDEELRAAGVDPAFLADPAYVRAQAILEGFDWFDAPFFGFSPREAEITNPQHRLFLECCWQALEDAGIDPAVFSGSGGTVGVFASGSSNTYILDLFARPELIRNLGDRKSVV